MYAFSEANSQPSTEKVFSEDCAHAAGFIHSVETMPFPRPLRSLLSPVCASLVAVVLFGGCGKAPESPGTNETEDPKPLTEAAEQTPADAPTDAPAAPAAEDVAAMPADSAPTPVSPALANLPTGLAESDAAYEAWFRKHGLDLNDPKMLEADPDGDGAANRDEFMADTDPRDPASAPGMLGNMKLKEYHEVQLPVVLEGVEGETARLKRTDGGPVEKVRKGQAVPGLGLTVGRIETRRGSDKNGELIDISRVTLVDAAKQEKATLVRDMPARSAESYAVLTSADGQQSINVRHGETFQWPNEGGASYKVVDLRQDQVVLQEIGSGRMWTVSKR